MSHLYNSSEVPVIDLNRVLTRLADRSRSRTEADVQSDVKEVLLYGGFDLADNQVALEVPAPDRRRIDVEVGFTVIEVKKDLRVGDTFSEGTDQLGQYMAVRQARAGERYAGILTDGADWHLFHLDTRAGPVEVARLTVDPAHPDTDRLRSWIEGVLATEQHVLPTPAEVAARLGAESSSCRLDLAELSEIYEECRTLPAVVVKRELWGKLLTVAFGTAFSDNTELFVNHTYLVAVAELVAHAVLGRSLSDPELDPAALLAGRWFDDAGIAGVVESDFFDWVADTPSGRQFVRTLARRLARFEWESVDHDVLKVLYESVIEQRTRHDLGEYYTPSWLAEKINAALNLNYLEDRILDPACGSGTFLFGLVRAALAACEAAGLSVDDAITSVTHRVFGIDVHPVAVTLARVNYLLAIGFERLGTRTVQFAVPVFLGDSVQWDETEELLDSGSVVVRTTDGAQLFDQELRFPQTTVTDAAGFDLLVAEMSAQATRRAPGSRVPSIAHVYDRHGVESAYRDTLDQTFASMCRLHDEGRDHIWAYYVRNRIRPKWLSLPENRVDAVLGNPPWLSYRHMTAATQARFRRLCQDRRLWAGPQYVTHLDLSALFVVRSIELYLKAAGTFGFVMPASVLSRPQYAGFRSADWSVADRHTSVGVRFSEPWDHTFVEPAIFPVPSGVVFGSKTDGSVYTGLPGTVVRWRGPQPAVGDEPLTSRREPSVRTPTRDDEWSVYNARFRNGATFYPRSLLMVERASAGPLGSYGGQVAVHALRTGQDREPWASLPRMEGRVEAGFIVPVLMSDSLLPFRLGQASLAVIGLVEGRLMNGLDPGIDQWPGFALWWREAERRWEAHRGDSTTLTLRQQVDYLSKLTRQVPIPAHRVIYNASGSHLTATYVASGEALVDHKLYWAGVSGQAEGRYLCAILNSPMATDLVAPLQSRGQFGTRDFHKWPWAIPVPEFNPGSPIHCELVAAAEEAEGVAAALDPSGTLGYVTLRSHIRGALASRGIHARLDELVRRLLGVT